MLNKKYILVLVLICIAFVMGCSNNKTNSFETEKEITMYVTTDIHYLAKDLNDNGEAFQRYIASGDGKLLGYIDQIVSAFTNEVVQKMPDILIISGDLTNNGEKESHKKLAEKLEEIEELTETRIYVIPGNHDILNPWARGFKGEEQYITDSIDADDFEKIYTSFGYNEAISRDNSSLSYLAAPSDKLWLLMLDTTINDFNELLGRPTTNGMIDEETFEWIKQCGQLAKDNNAQIVTVMHHNLFDHNQVLNSGFTIDNNDEVLSAFQESGLNLILSGHVHIQNIKSSGDENNQIYDIVTSALSVYPVQYGVLKFVPSQGFDYSTEKVDVEGWAKEGSIMDENLNNFKKFAKDYFYNASFKKAYEQLRPLDSYSVEEKEKMADTMSQLNINYFGGTIESIKNDVIESRGYQLWIESTEPAFMKSYILSMISDSNINHNQLFISFKE